MLLIINFDMLSGFNFKCPYCGKSYSVFEAKTEKILASSELVDRKIKNRMVVNTYMDSYYKVRFCKKCYERKIKTKKILYTSIFILGTILYSIYLFNDIGGFEFSSLGFILLFWLFLLFGISVLNWILNNTIYAVDFEEAYKNNAIDNSFL